MTKQHQATPDDWAQQEDWANRSVFSDSSCILELRGRVEALEVGQQPQQDKLDRLIAIDRDDPTEAAAQRGQPMSTDYRALCVELLDELQALRLAVAYEVGCPSPEPPVVLRARAELVKPEPEGVTDEELLAMRSWSCHGPTFDSDLVDFGRRCYNLGRYGTPANALPTPEAP
jgi:hypothetical protein